MFVRCGKLLTSPSLLIRLPQLDNIFQIFDFVINAGEDNTICYDRSTTGLNGILQSDATPTPILPQYNSYGLNFIDTNKGYISFPLPDPTIQPPFTICTYLTMSSPEGRFQGLVNFRSDGNRRFSLVNDYPTTTYRASANNYKNWRHNQTPNLDNFKAHFIGMLVPTIDVLGARFILDSTNIGATATIRTIIESLEQNIYLLGKYSSYYLKATLHYMCIWKSALSIPEIELARIYMLSKVANRNIPV